MDTKYIRHGDECLCETCGAPGTFDEMKLGSKNNEVEFEDAVWINAESGLCECYECWLK